MTALLLEPTTDWTGQTYEERLLLCAETLFFHGLIKDRTYHHATAQLRARAAIQRDRQVRDRQKEPRA